MTQRTIIYLTIICVLGVCLASFGGSFMATQISFNQRNAQIESLKHDIAAIKTRIETTNEKQAIPAQKFDTEEIARTLDDLSGKLDNLQGDIDSIKLDLNHIESDVSNIQLKIGY